LTNLRGECAKRLWRIRRYRTRLRRNPTTRTAQGDSRRGEEKTDHVANHFHKCELSKRSSIIELVGYGWGKNESTRSRKQGMV